MGPRGFLRFVWTQLTSMRTALVLLFALALAAIPGSLIPQRTVSPVRVADFIRDNPTLGPLYDRVGLFNVFTSAWFSSIYLLLFVSLIGCILPRIRVYWRAVRSQPPAMPARLDRPMSRLSNRTTRKPRATKPSTIRCGHEVRSMPRPATSSSGTPSAGPSVR